MHALVPVDDRAASWNALRFAADRAEAVNGTLHVAHVAAQHTDPDAVQETVTDILSEYDVDYEFDIYGVEQSPLLANEVAEKLEDVFDPEYTEIIMGNGLDDSLRTVLNGSVSKNLIEQQTTPVMLVPDA